MYKTDTAWCTYVCIQSFAFYIPAKSASSIHVIASWFSNPVGIAVTEAASPGQENMPWPVNALLQALQALPGATDTWDVCIQCLSHPAWRHCRQDCADSHASLRRASYSAEQSLFLGTDLLPQLYMGSSSQHDGRSCMSHKCQYCTLHKWPKSDQQSQGWLLASLSLQRTPHAYGHHELHSIHDLHSILNWSMWGNGLMAVSMLHMCYTAWGRKLYGLSPGWVKRLFTSN